MSNCDTTNYSQIDPQPPAAAAATDDDDDDNNINGEILLSSRGSIKEIGRGKETEHKTLIVPLMAIVCRRVREWW